MSKLSNDVAHLTIQTLKTLKLCNVSTILQYTWSVPIILPDIEGKTIVEMLQHNFFFLA